MRSKAELSAMADALVALIRKHHGYLDEDGETVRFFRFSDAEAFRDALAGKQITSEAFDAATKQLEG